MKTASSQIESDKTRESGRPESESARVGPQGRARRIAGGLVRGVLTLGVLATPLVTLWFMRQVEVDASSGSTPKWETARHNRPTVELVSPQWVKDDRPIRASGTIRAWRAADLSFLATGHVETVKVDFGDRVEAGAALAELDRTQTSAVVAEARARLEEAEWEWRRVAGLANKALAADTEVARRKAGLEAARAQLQRAEHMYDGGVLKAPFAGYIAERRIEVGQFIGPRQPAFLLVELDRIKIEMGVTEGQLGRLSKGDAASFRVEAYPGQVFTGQVRRLGVYTPQASGTFAIVIVAANESAMLKPGMVATIRIQPKITPKLLVLPVDATRFRGDQAMVFFYDAVAGFVEQRPVETGPLLPIGVVIRSGLTADDRVVMRPGVSLYTGQRVAVADDVSEKSTRAVAGHPMEPSDPSSEGQEPEVVSP